MAWEYLTESRFDERYKIASQAIDFSDKVVLDLDCGDARFRWFIKCKKYIGNDVRIPPDTTKMEFLIKKDSDVDVAHDVLCVFGYGGGELTGEPLESGTLRKTIYRLAEKYLPQYIVLESVRRWEEEFGALTEILNKLNEFGYSEALRKETVVEPVDHYHNKRVVIIVKR